ncbi:FadR/GntR family transcriptional regulator [Microbacterium rhizosphaerae]|uniref:FCD domain-containing protein n=1 Tax=Microbacterium rhizosphaerae TaxID=1678237 RepID=A0ABZ0SIE4_9MICO|nr:FCD domain-containing protein [Microbacterium rhizosphaerae]WPR89112.1 FCD domain-containing protein [Microbacterium rhizosphaerae]
MNPAEGAPSKIWGLPFIVSTLEDDIVSGRLAPGVKLPSERELMTRFSVGRSLVRESLRVLRERGLIEVSLGRGSFVREMDPKDDGASPELLSRTGLVTARHLIAAREMLETNTAALAAANRTQEDLERLAMALAELESAPLRTAADFDLAFHTAIADASHNPVLQVMFSSISTLAHQMMVRSLTDEHVVGAELHGVLFERISVGDAAGAARVMAEHISAAKLFYGADLDTPLRDLQVGSSDLTLRVDAIMRKHATSAQGA